MFVTSDIFDLKQIAWDRGIADWRERLVGGITFHGTDYPGAVAGARFLIKAAEICGLDPELALAGYSIQWGEPSEHVEPSSFADLARLPGALEAKSIYLMWSEGSITTHDRLDYGGGLGAAPRMAEDSNERVPDYPYRAFDGYFAWPLDGPGLERAQALLRAAAEILRADYGYYFVRDALADPEAYVDGTGGRVDQSRLGSADHLEREMWDNFVRTGELWTGVWPQLRDIFAVNLISERHMCACLQPPPELALEHAQPIGYLEDWINAEPGRGRLTFAAPGRVLWTLTDEELHAVRPILWDAALMRTCMPRVYRDLPYARARPDPATGKVTDRTSGT